MNKIKIEDKKTLIKKDTSIHLYTDSDSEKVYEVSKDAKLVVFHYSKDSSHKIIVNLNGENAEVEYHYSTINYSDHTYQLMINHYSSNTISHVYNHGVNILENQLHFEIVGNVEKDRQQCICNQSNQIINLNEGKTTIVPILLIDHYQVDSTHSAYIGKFKDDIIFYMMSRGIKRNNAIKLLMEALLINEGETCIQLEQFKKEIDKI